MDVRVDPNVSNLIAFKLLNIESYCFVISDSNRLRAASTLRAKRCPGSGTTLPNRSVLLADEAAVWNDLHARYEVNRIAHELTYSIDGACTNQAELYSSAGAVARWAITTTSRCS